MRTACWRRGVRVGVQSALLVAGGAALAVGEGIETCLSGDAPWQSAAAQADSPALQPRPARNEFAVKYLKGKRGFGGKMDGVLVLAADRVCFRNRRGDREFTIVRESAQAQVTTKQKMNIGCWFGAATLALGAGMVDPDQLCQRTEYRVEVEAAAADGSERIIFKPAKVDASALVAAFNHRGAYTPPTH